MNDNTHFPSMAAHSLYLAPSLALQTRNANAGMPRPPACAVVPSMHDNLSAAAPIRFERILVPKRGRSSDMPESSDDSMDHDGLVEEHQRCIYYRNSRVFTNPKRAKAVVETQV
ncbi:hypothetical protein H4R99_004739 [Coemansia sp. RSA 1722]|nr:hypothetical protein IWW45_001913 [Coemansia sp. RSA 485]KAJ2596858.1 hypothetical protein H4R99_004739 [Coemansia sp. RSA 1722]